MKNAARIHSQLKIWFTTTVATTAMSMPISPAKTPRRAVDGVFIHLRDRMNSAAEMM